MEQNKYEWSEAQLYVLESLDSQNERIRGLEDKIRTTQTETAVTKSTIAIFGGIAGIVSGGVVTILVEIAVRFFFK